MADTNQDRDMNTDSVDGQQPSRRRLADDEIE